MAFSIVTTPRTEQTVAKNYPRDRRYRAKCGGDEHDVATEFFQYANLGSCRATASVVTL